MAGAALTTPLTVKQAFDVSPLYPIKSAEVVNEGDLVGLDSNGQIVVASKTQAAVVIALGFALFTDEHGTATTKTGVAGLTVKCAIARRGRISGFSGLTVGGRVYLDAAPTGGADNYWQTTTFAFNVNDQIQQVGRAISATEIEVNVDQTLIGYQTVATTLAKVI